MKASLVVILIIISSYFNVFSQTLCSGLSTDTVYSSISVSQAHDTINALINKNWFVIIDVRTPGEYNGGHIREAINVDYNSSSFNSIIASFDRSKVYIVYCASGSRSGQAFNKMQTLDFRRVYNVTGGLNAWNAAGFLKTTDVMPITGACDTGLIFSEIPINTTVSDSITITNAANGTLTLLQFTDLSTSPFSVDIQPNQTISGGKDYTFHVLYTPDDAIKDSIVFSLITNADTVNYTFIGNPLDTTTALAKENLSKLFIHQNSFANTLMVSNLKSNQKYKVEIYNINGSILYSGWAYDNFHFNYSGITRGLYIVKLCTSSENHVFKVLF